MICMGEMDVFSCVDGFLAGSCAWLSSSAAAAFRSQPDASKASAASVAPYPFSVRSRRDHAALEAFEGASDAVSPEAEVSSWAITGKAPKKSKQDHPTNQQDRQK